MHFDSAITRPSGGAYLDILSVRLSAALLAATISLVTTTTPAFAVRELLCSEYSQVVATAQRSGVRCTSATQGIIRLKKLAQRAKSSTLKLKYKRDLKVASRAMLKLCAKASRDQSDVESLQWACEISPDATATPLPGTTPSAGATPTPAPLLTPAPLSTPTAIPNATSTPRYRDWPVTPDEIASTQEITDNRELLSDKILIARGSYWSKRIVEMWRRIYFRPSCWSYQLRDVNYEVFHVQDLENYAVQRGYGDAEAIETQDNSDRERHKGESQAVIDAAADKIQYRVWAQEVECGDDEWDRIHRYASYITEFIEGYKATPKAGLLFITMVVTPRVNDISVRQDDDLIHLYVFAPSQLEPLEWDRKIRDALLPYVLVGM